MGRYDGPSRGTENIIFFLVEVGIVYQSHFGENETKEKYNRNIVDSANFHLICKNPNDRKKENLVRLFHILFDSRSSASFNFTGFMTR